MDPDVTLYTFRLLGCVQILVVLVAAGCAGWVFAKAKAHGLKPAGPALIAASLVLSGLNGLLFMVIDWIGPAMGTLTAAYVVASGFETIIALLLIVGLALLGRAKPSDSVREAA